MRKEGNPIVMTWHISYTIYPLPFISTEYVKTCVNDVRWKFFENGFWVSMHQLFALISILSQNFILTSSPGTKPSIVTLETEIVVKFSSFFFFCFCACFSNITHSSTVRFNFLHSIHQSLLPYPKLRLTFQCILLQWFRSFRSVSSRVCFLFSSSIFHSFCLCRRMNGKRC